MKVEPAGKRVSVVGEGPHWDSRSSTLIYDDAKKCEIVRFDPQAKTESVVASLDGLIGNVIPYAQDNRQLMVCMEKGVYRLDTDTLNQTLLAELVDSSEPTRFNDGKCDAAGRLWAGTMPRILNFQKLPQGGHHLYSYSKGRLSLKASEMSLSNGITWTSDNRTMFHNDSFPGRTSVFDFDLDTGAISNRRVFVEFKSTLEYRDLGSPDGMTIDVNNKLWMVCFGSGFVIQVDPETAEILTKVQLPTKYTTSCCFGGENYDVLYVTSASLFSSAPLPSDGLLYQVTELGVKGKAPFEFAG
ncbi:unnamed protein product [Ixodes pacificus]